MRIAVVGAGVSGLVAALYLSRRHRVTLFEKEARLGGHAHTHAVNDNGRVLAIDSGFIVYNHETYPNFTRLLRELEVEGQASDMSFGVRCRRCRLEYSSRGLRGLFAQRRRAFDLGHHAMLADIPRFNQRARRFLMRDERDRPLREFLESGRHGRGFLAHFLKPMAAAIWSSTQAEIGAASTRSFLGFFANHGWLTLDGAHRWRTIKGGSRTYVDAIRRFFKDEVRCSTRISSILRDEAGVVVTDAERRAERFDKVVLAVHANDALRLLSDARPVELDLLNRFRYSKNRAVLHTDVSAMPRGRDAWASWNSDLEDCRDDSAPVALTYHLSRLQSLPGPTEYMVSLNGRPPADPRVIAEMTYSHPILDARAVAAQGELDQLSGESHTYFCGAHLRHGFHEDGVVSALRVAEKLGVAA